MTKDGDRPTGNIVVHGDLINIQGQVGTGSQTMSGEGAHAHADLTDAEARYRAQLARQADDRPWLGEVLGKQTITEVRVEVRLAPEERLAKASEVRGPSEARAVERMGGRMKLQDAVGLSPDGRAPRWVLRGAPGSGKTTLLHLLALDLLKQPDGPLPVLLHVEDLRGTRSLAEAVSRAWSLAEFGAAAERAVAEARAVVLVDGLDEALASKKGASGPREAAQLLSKWQVHAKECPLVVATRPVDHQRPVGFHILDVEPLEPEEQQ